MEPLLNIEQLQVEFLLDRAKVRAVDGVNLSLRKGEIVGLVGESGCGKSVTALSVMGLLAPNARVEGAISLSGDNLLTKSEKAMQRIRGNRISMIFQEPMTSLNPVFSIQEQLEEVIALHQGGSKEEITQKTVDMLSLVGISEPERRMKEYPHQMSGGMQQRVMISMALACNPDVLIADEPTTALDVTIQAQILSLIRDLQEKLETGVLMITHDLGVVAQVSHHVTVMYAGQVVESAGVKKLFKDPRHPYTKSLLRTIPQAHGRRERLVEIKGMVPDLLELPEGCRFYPRCDERMDVCKEKAANMIKTEEGAVRCWLYQ